MDKLFIIISAAAGASLIAALVCWYAFRFEPFNFKLSEITINLKSARAIPGQAKNPEPFLKILHLSDFHLRKDNKGRRLFDFIKSLEKLEPDLVLLTGDLVEKDAYFPYLTEMLSGLKARLGKFAVFGVHDYYHKMPVEFLQNMLKKKKIYRRENNVGLLIRELNSVGIKVLRNEKISLDLKKYKPGKSGIGRLEIAGIDDAVIKKANAGIAFGHGADDRPTAGASNRDKYGKLFSKNKSGVHTLKNDEKIVICITHTPDMALMAELVKNGADIIIAGHTHGGQVRLPIIGAIISGAHIPVKYASGLFYFRQFVLYISRGLGEGRYSPFRFYCQPEATLININCLF